MSTARTSAAAGASLLVGLTIGLASGDDRKPLDPPKVVPASITCTDGAVKRGQPCDLDGDGVTCGRWRCPDEPGPAFCNEAAGARAYAEICNGQDDDCDGRTDEDFPNLRQPCSSVDVRNGRYACATDGTVACTPPTPSETP